MHSGWPALLTCWQNHRNSRIRKHRATARKDGGVDPEATKARNSDFNPEVDGCETFVMKDGSVAQWMPGQQRYSAHS